MLVAGDLAGKALIPLVRSNGGWHGEQGGRELVARDEDELEALERSLADKGLYAIAIGEEELGDLRDPEAVERRFLAEIVSRTEDWMKLAGDPLAEGADAAVPDSGATTTPTRLTRCSSTPPA